MATRTTVGEKGDLNWQVRSVGAGTSRALSVLVLPVPPAKDAAAGSWLYVPAAPQLQRDGAGAPVFSLTLVLTRQPAATETSITPLIQSAVLTLGLTLALPDDAVAALSGGDTSAYQPLFARSATFALVHAATKGPEPAPVTTAGPNASASLSATIDRQTALGVLAALNGQPSGLLARCAVTYKTDGPDPVARLSGEWVRVYDALVPRLGPDGVLSAADLRTAFDDLVKTGTLLVALDGVDDPSAVADELFAGFLSVSSAVLRRETPALAPGDPGNRYTLRPRPPAGFRLDVRRPLAAPTYALELSAPLEEVGAGAFDGLSLDGFVHVVAPDANGGLGPVPRRVTNERSVRDRAPGGEDTTSMAHVADGLRAVKWTLRPDSTAAVPARGLLATDLVAPVAAPGAAPGAARLWAVDDAAVTLARPPVHHVPDPWNFPDPDFPTPPVPVIPSLPQVDDPSAPLWADRATPSRFWYPPEFTLVTPAPNADPASSPFLFTYTQSGATAAAKPGLDGTVKFTLRSGMSAATAAALRARSNPPAQPVPVYGLSVALELPFRDQSGATRSQTVDATVQTTGDVTTATVRLIDDWVRLCYGALAYPNFQAQPARLSVSYSFTGSVPIGFGRIDLGPSRKVAYTPVVPPGDPRPQDGRAYIDAQTLTYHLPVGALRFTPEAAVAAPALNGRRTAGGASTALVEAPRITTSAAPAARPPEVLIARPALEEAAIVQNLVAQTRYVTRSTVRRAEFDVLLPCATFGALYRQVDGATTVAIGCRDALQLGQTTYRQYEEMTDLSAPTYRVFRSLQQPGRFLVLPAAYRITRYAATEPDGRAFRPLILLYATLDPVTQADNRCLFQTTLQPDIDPAARRELIGRLGSSALNPVVVYPTEIECQPSYAFALDAALNVHPTPVLAWDSIQIGFETDLAGGLLVQNVLENTGLSGTVTFTLPDGTALISLLDISLNRITGPWASGPVPVGLSGPPNVATLTNRIERDVTVSDLMVYPGPGPGHPVPVNRKLPAGAATTVALSAPASEALPVVSILPGAPAALHEVNAFVEDLTVNVIFINLVNFANHGLAGMSVAARIKGVGATVTAAISEAARVATINLRLPLTSYLGNQTLQYQVTKVAAAGATSVTPWIDWDLSKGNVVSLVWEQIQ
jgi:hypothetical protein